MSWYDDTIDMITDTAIVSICNTDRSMIHWFADKHNNSASWSKGCWHGSARNGRAYSPGRPRGNNAPEPQAPGLGPDPGGTPGPA